MSDACSIADAGNPALDAAPSPPREALAVAFRRATVRMVITTADGRLIDVNPACGRMLDYSRKEFLALPARSFRREPATVDHQDGGGASPRVRG